MKNRLFERGRFALLAAALMLLAATGSTSAATSNLGSSARVLQSCVVSTSQHINFGVYDPLVTHRVSKPTGMGYLSLRCSMGNTIVRASNGLNSSRFIRSSRPAGYPASSYGTYNTYGCARSMMGPGNTTVRYEIGFSANNTHFNLFPEMHSNVTPPTCTPTSGQNQALAVVSFSGLEEVSVPIFARVVDSETSSARPGAYSDSLIITVVF